MRAFISKSVISGKAAAPPSKSYTIRGLMCAALARGESLIRNPLKADDTAATVNVLSRAGVNITEDKSDWRVAGGDLKKTAGELYCRESAATLRFMTAVAAQLQGRTTLTFGPSLARRPIQPLLDALSQLGVISHIKNNSIVVEGRSLEGGTVRMPGDMSSQFISALLLIAPRTERGLTIELKAPPRSKPYIFMTLESMKHFGVSAMNSPDMSRFQVAPQSYKPATYQVEGDWSQASYLLALGALAGEALVTNLNSESLQADRVILNLLQKMGACFSQRGGSVMVSRSPLRAIMADICDAIDLLPTLAVLAAMAEGESEFHGIANARLKESNRVLALREELSKAGVRVIEEKDTLKVIGGQPRGAILDSRADHRLAMAFSLLGAFAGNTTVLGAESVAKTYPEFWRVFQSLGGQVKLDV